jgi:hypothetical protein
VTCDQLHCIPYRRIAPGVSQAFLTKPQKNGSAAQVLWGVYGSCDNLFLSRKKRWGALANTKSLATKFIGNGIDALLFLFFERFSAVSRTKFSGNFFRNFKILKNKYDKNTPVSQTLAVIRVYKLKKREHVKNAYVISHIFVRKPLL